MAYKFINEIYMDLFDVHKFLTIMNGSWDLLPEDSLELIWATFYEHTKTYPVLEEYFNDFDNWYSQSDPHKIINDMTAEEFEKTFSNSYKLSQLSHDNLLYAQEVAWTLQIKPVMREFTNNETIIALVQLSDNDM